MNDLSSLKPISYYATGEASFLVLKDAVNEFTRFAPEDHDIMIHAFGLTVHEIRYIAPHIFIFNGFDNNGNETMLVIHYSQLVAHIVSLPKRSEKREVIGFSSS
jgi:hypothetical protein